jgi:TetR/AcrR family transcriptional regulator
VSFREPFAHRDELLAAAVDAFVEAGYEGASLNAILTAAGMSKGQFYHHFAGKQELYLAVCEAMIDRKASHFAANPVPILDDPFATIEGTLRAGLEFAGAHPDLDAFGRAFLRERGRPIFDLVLRAFPLAADLPLREAIGRGLALGAFSAEYPPGFAARAIGVVIARASELIDDADVEGSVQAIGRFLRRGLAARAE